MGWSTKLQDCCELLHPDFVGIEDDAAGMSVQDMVFACMFMESHLVVVGDWSCMAVMRALGSRHSKVPAQCLCGGRFVCMINLPSLLLVILRASQVAHSSHLRYPWALAMGGGLLVGSSVSPVCLSHSSIEDKPLMLPILSRWLLISQGTRPKSES